MLHITNTKLNKEVTVDLESFYTNVLSPMIYSERPLGARWWGEEERTFFNISNPDSITEKTQMRMYFRYFKPTLEQFIQIATTGSHPLREMSDKPYNYNKEDTMYMFELDTGEEIYLGQHLDCIVLKYEPKSG
jgi:hypothetical protein